MPAGPAVQDDADLRPLSTMRLGGRARHLATVRTAGELVEAERWARSRGLPLIVVGDGSNIVWRDEGFDGLVVRNRIAGLDLVADGPDRLVTAGAGENWDAFVEYTVRAGLTGVEALSLIPGTVGATPVQNVGAYGQDVSRTLVRLAAYDRREQRTVSLTGGECGFGYRSSRFNGVDRGRFLITAVTFRLRAGDPPPPSYRPLAEYLAARPGTPRTPAAVREAVRAIRSAKLPDPALVANCGSFFANPVVEAGLLDRLRAGYPDLPAWPTGDPGRHKLPAAWLIEQAGFKGHRDGPTGMATWPHQPLVLVNEHARTTADLLAYSRRIVAAVQERFGVTLVREPELLP